MRKALLIVYSFPPSSHSNATRPYLLAKKLLEKGWVVDVLCSTYGMSAEDAELLTHKNLYIRRVKDPLRFVYHRCFGLEKKIRLLANMVMWPDIRIAWVMRTLFSCCRRENYDVVIGGIVPRSMLFGPLLKRKLGKKWVLDYQEPVSVERLGWVRKMPIQVLFWPLLRRLEHSALKRCDNAVFTCESCRSEYVARHLIDRRKTSVFYHCYDESLFTETGCCKGQRFDIVYAGNFAGRHRGNRSPRTFLHAFRTFLNGCPEAIGSARFVFYGTWLPEHDIYLDELDLRSHVVLNERVSYDKYIDIIKKGPILLLVISPQHYLHLPGKVVEYFGAKRPVLAFVDEHSEVNKILVDAGFGEFTCSVNDSDAGSQSIQKLWRLWNDGKLNQVDCDTSEWSSAFQIEQYAERIVNLVQESENKGCRNV